MSLSWRLPCFYRHFSGPAVCRDQQLK